MHYVGIAFKMSENVEARMREIRETFEWPGRPDQKTHGHLYALIVGPFKDAAAAEKHALKHKVVVGVV